MKKLLLSACLCLVIMVSYGQEFESKFDHVSLGGNINQYQRDFGIGINITSPFWGTSLRSAFRLTANHQYLEYIDDNLETVWTGYQNLRFGYVMAHTPAGGFFRYYGEGGFILLFPNNDFSDDNVKVGGYGLFGFEFLFAARPAPKAVFIELGAVGTGAVAEKVVTEPIYSNGFLISTGFRFALGAGKKE